MDTEKDEHGEVGLCPLLRQQAQELSSRPPKRARRARQRHGVRDVRVLQGCNNVRRIALSRAPGHPLPCPMGPLANSSLHQPYHPQWSGYDWLLSSPAHDKRVSHPVRKIHRTRLTDLLETSFECVIVIVIVLYHYPVFHT